MIQNRRFRNSNSFCEVAGIEDGFQAQGLANQA